MELFDSHAHYNDEKFEKDQVQILKKVYESGVTKLVCAGYSLESSKKAVQIADQNDFVYAIVGISPNDLPQIKENTQFQEQFLNQLEEVKKIAEHKKVVAIGEIGLDYYWNEENREQQKWAFIKQIELANELKLPIVIHTREAIFDTLEILKKQECKGVFHCCPLNIDLIREGLKLGFYISFAGPVTFKNAKNAQNAINEVPIDKMLIETDSPYLAPEPVRGSRNNSENVKYIAQKIAQVKGIPVEEVAKKTYQNAKKIFSII
ncbi:MAG: TatD family hydrolase [Clostridia bacterium]|nr:TatD family hydrolase [Clostridia bacterium]